MLSFQLVHVAHHHDCGDDCGREVGDRHTVPYAMQYESGASAAVAFKSGNGSTFTMGFPFECIKDERLRSQLMAGILKYLTEE